MTAQNFFPIFCRAAAFRRSALLLALCCDLSLAESLRAGALPSIAAAKAEVSAKDFSAAPAEPLARAGASLPDFIPQSAKPAAHACSENPLKSQSGRKVRGLSVRSARGGQGALAGPLSAAESGLIALLHAKDMAALQEIIERGKERSFLAALCERQKERSKIPSACYQLCPSSIEAERHCLSLPLKSLEISSIQAALPLKSISPACRQKLRQGLRALQYRKAKKQKKQWSGEDFSVME